MPIFRIERTELHTRVWFIEAENEEAALDAYTAEDDDEAEGWHEGSPSVTVEQLDRCTCAHPVVSLPPHSADADCARCGQPYRPDDGGPLPPIPAACRRTCCATPIGNPHADDCPNRQE